MVFLGAHISIAGGIHLAPSRGREVKAEAIQIFTANQRQWAPKEPSPVEINEFRRSIADNRIKSCISHAGYLINLCSADDVKYKKSVAAFQSELERADKLGLDAVVIHPGAHLSLGEDRAIEKVARTLTDICQKKCSQTKVQILIETTAGQGTNMGYRFEHLAAIIERVSPSDQIGVCFDTAHVFAAGYDISTPEKMMGVLDEFDSIVGLEKIEVIHLNDTNKECGSRVDRHCSIGVGKLGIEPFRLLLNMQQFDSTAAILETPVESWSDYAREIQLLVSLIEREQFKI